MNTLITKTPESVTDDTMIRLGEFGFYVKTSVRTNGIITFSAIKQGKARIVGTAQFTDSAGTAQLGQELQYSGVAASTNFYCTPGEFFIFFEGKYDVTSFVFVDTVYNDVNTEARFVNSDFTFSPVNTFTFFKVGLNLDLLDLSVLESYAGGLNDDASKFVNGVIKRINSDYAKNCPSDFSDFAALTSLTRLNLRVFVQKTSDISVLASLVNLTELRFDSCDTVSGAIEDVLDGMFANGRTSGTLSVQNVYTPNVTYNGSTMGNMSFTFSSNGWTVNS